MARTWRVASSFSFERCSSSARDVAVVGCARLAIAAARRTRGSGSARTDVALVMPRATRPNDPSARSRASCEATSRVRMSLPASFFSPRTSARTMYARVPSAAVALAPASVVTSCMALGAGERASASAAKYPSCRSARSAGAHERGGCACLGRAPERTNRRGAELAIGMVDRAGGEQLRDLCIVHAFGEPDADRCGGVVGDERRDCLEALRRREEHEGLAAEARRRASDSAMAARASAIARSSPSSASATSAVPRSVTSLARVVRCRISSARRSPSCPSMRTTAGGMLVPAVP